MQGKGQTEGDKVVSRFAVCMRGAVVLPTKHAEEERMERRRVRVAHG